MGKTLGILTGGGDCPGLNPAIRGCVLRAMEKGWTCVGIQDGWKGLLEKRTQPLGLAEVEEIIGRGGTILGTSRTNPHKQSGGAAACVTNLQALGLDALVAMGGEDTLGVAHRLFTESKFPVVGVPKTMDNDLSATDFTFGFDTAVTVAVDAAERLRDTGRSHRRVMVLEVMGRHAGWVALYTGIAAGADWTLVPEAPPNLPAMSAHLKKAHARKRHALVVVSEGVELGLKDEGAPQADGFGHAILGKRGVGEALAVLIEEETGIETRSAVIGHVQRGGSPTLFDRMLGTRVGVAAAEYVAAGQFGQMAALRGTQVVPVSLSEAVAKLKTVTPDWIALLKTLQP